MAEVQRDRPDLLASMVDAFARGDNVGGELLFQHALDRNVPWDQLTSAAARGVARRYARPIAVDGLVFEVQP
jgi:hypothetical protein